MYKYSTEVALKLWYTLTMKKLLFILLGLIIIAGAGAAAYFLYFAPQPSAKRLADNVMRSASLNQADAVSGRGTSDGVERFVDASSQRNFRHIHSTQADGTFYISYEFTDEQSPKKARIGVQNSQVSHLAVGDNIGNTPADDTPEPVAEAAGPDHCLTREDLRYLDSARPYAQNFRAATMIFETGGNTGYAGEENGRKLLDRIGGFYKRSHAKDYQIMLRGYAPEPEAYPEEYRTQVDHSTNRANRILEELVEREVSRDRITIDNPRIYNDAPFNNQNDWVDIDIVSRCEG